MGAANPVIKAHGPLHQGQPGSLAGQARPDPGLSLEKQVQIPAGQVHDPAVEHGVDVIRAAFEAFNCYAPPLERTQQAAGHNRLSASAVHGGEHQPLHDRPPVMRNTGF